MHHIAKNFEIRLCLTHESNLCLSANNINFFVDILLFIIFLFLDRNIFKFLNIFDIFYKPLIVQPPSIIKSDPVM